MMFKSVLTASAAVALLAGAVVPTFASAQTYGGAYGAAQVQSQAYGDSYYDPCRRSTTNRSTGGGLAGAGIGAAIGSGIAGRGAKTEGAVLGGLLGAVIGSNIGKQSAACAPSRDSRYQGAYDNGYYGADRGRYDDRYENARTADRRDEDGYETERSYPVTDSRAEANGCTLAESPIYLPDGSVQKRFVRVCPDAQGRYQVVD